MTRTRTQLAYVGIALLLVASVAPPSMDTATAAENSFVVEQGDRCIEVTPLQGDETAEEFYDYRNPENSEEYTYSSYMPRHLQQDDVSRLFLYEGSDGVSLVMVHNEVGADGDGSAATFRFEGLPDGGEWVVMDDGYDDRDDRFSRDRIDWTWYGDRTDGAAFRGVDRAGTAITVRPAFNDGAALYDRPVERSGSIQSWQFLSGDLGNPDAERLDMSRPVTVRTGHCTDETPPEAALAASDGVAGHEVTLDASGSSDNRGVEEYRWDFDGDGEVERTTASATVAHAYDEPGEYRANVTVVDGGDNDDTAGANLTVDPDDPPSAALDVATESPTEGFRVSLDASESSDDVGVAEYRWDFDGDGEVDRTTDDPSAGHVYNETGTYDASVTVVDGSDQNDTATASVEVGDDEPPEPDLELARPDYPVAGEQVVLDASNTTDDTGVAEYRWEFGDDANATGETVTHTYAENGTYAVTLEVVDEGNNSATETMDLSVNPPDETPPEVSVTADRTRVEAGTSVSLDASDSADDETGIAEYRWDFNGDGDPDGTTEVPTATTAYGSPGTYDATVTVTDREGNAATANVTVEVLAAGQPTAELSVSDDETTVDDEVTFDASDSSDNETGIEEYRWDFDGDGETDETTEDASVDHAYEEVDTYDASVTVVDGGNNTDTATVNVTVEAEEKAHPGDDEDSGGDSGDGDSGGSAGGGGGGGGGGPPPVITDTQERGANAALVDVRNARSDEAVTMGLPETEVAAETGVRFDSVDVDLAADDPHFAVETARDDENATDLPSDVALGSLAVDSRYVDAADVSSVAYEAEVERSRLDDAGLAAEDLTVFQRTDGEWRRVEAEVEERDGTVFLRADASALADVAVGADRTATLTDAALADGEVAATDPVEVTATVENEGEEPREFTTELTVDGEVVDQKTVEVPGGETAEIEFERQFDPGTHEVGVGGERVGSVTVAEPEPDIGVADLSLSDSTIEEGQQVEITATVENSGTAAGEREVGLTLFGERLETETVELDAGETTEVTFVQRVDAPGSYEPAVGDRSAELEVEGGSDGEGDGDLETPGVPGFGVGAAVVALLAAALLARLRGPDST